MNHATPTKNAVITIHKITHHTVLSDGKTPHDFMASSPKCRVACCNHRACVPPSAILIPFILLAVFADWIAPYDPTEPIPGAKIFQPPFWMQGGSIHALLGTDFQARDLLSRLIFGARVSLIVGVMGTVVAGGIGTALGILSGYLGGWVDQVIMRVTDAWLALPALVFAIFLATMVGPSMWNIIIILGLVYWTRYARV